MPTTAEISEETGVPTHELDQFCATRTSRRPAIDPNDISAGSLPDIKADKCFETDTVVAHNELRLRLMSAMKALPSRDRQILILYHWRSATMREIGALFHINESRVSQIHKRALERMAVTLQSVGITSSSSVLFR